MTDPSPEECHKQNIHNRTLADIQAAAGQWEVTPAIYPVLDLSSMFGSKKKNNKQVGYQNHEQVLV